MTVEKQTFEQAKAARVPSPTMITDVVATLRGSQPESAGRTYVVSGHYDSMCTSPTDATCDAPGANDDASGTAAVLEMARVMAKYEFDATIVFMAVAGEEQGLLGSTYFAEQAKQKGMTLRRCSPTTLLAVRSAPAVFATPVGACFLRRGCRQTRSLKRRRYVVVWW